MKTIKFRGKRLNDGEWVYGSLLKHDKIDLAVIVNIDNIDKSTIVKITTSVDPNTIGQFTGLYDKNGEEIYEGDILQWGEGDYKIKQVVMFLHGAFGYKCDPYTFIPYVGNTNFDFWAKGTDHRFEIIGNIHDNPELQKGGEE